MNGFKTCLRILFIFLLVFKEDRTNEFYKVLIEKQRFIKIMKVLKVPKNQRDSLYSRLRVISVLKTIFN